MATSKTSKSKAKAVSKNKKRTVVGIVAVAIVAIAALITAVLIVQNGGKINAVINYGDEDKSATITIGEEDTAIIETGRGEVGDEVEVTEVNGEEIKTVESVDATGPVMDTSVEEECPEGEECGQGATTVDVSSPTAFKNATLGGCWNMDGYYGAQSLVAGTQILTADGTYQNVETLEAGDKILAADGVTVNTVANNTTTDELIYEVETNNGYIRGTAGHKVFVNGEAIELQNLEEGMVIDTPEVEGVDLGLTDDEYRFLGMWLGDGTYHVVRGEYAEIIITVGTDEKRDYLRSLDLEMTERTHSNGEATIFYLRTSETKLYEVIGQYSDKNIPVLSEGADKVIEGFIRADGSEKDDHRYVVTNTNRTLLATIQEMAWQIGYQAKLSKGIDRESTNLSDNPKTIYRLSVNVEPRQEKERGEVLKVTNTGEYEAVYHLNVWEENHSYIADGLAHHNCWDLADLFWVSYVGRTLTTCGTGAAKGTIADGCWQKNAGSEFTMIWDATQLQAGDWVVFNTGTWGHIGMAMGSYNNGYITLLGQNQGGNACEGGGSSTNIINISLKDFAGAFRPNSYIVPEPEPEPEPEPTPEPEDEYIYYTVKAGDTLGGILYGLGYTGTKMFGDDGFAQAVATENGIANRGLIFPNQIIKVKKSDL